MANAASVAFSAAFAATVLELLTTKYPRTARLFWYRSRALWLYGLSYGTIAAAMTLCYPWLARHGLVRLLREGVGAAPEIDSAGGSIAPTPFVVAVVLGLSVKALLHVRLFTISLGAPERAIPVGTETFTRLFEPELLRAVMLDEYLAVSRFLEPIVARHGDLERVQRTIGGQTPITLDEAERLAFMADIDAAPDARTAIELYLREFGVALVRRAFPVRRRRRLLS